MIFKITFSATGDLFLPSKIIDKVNGNFVIKSIHSPGDQFANREGAYDFGTISYWHPKQFATDDNIAAYEDDFIQFITANQQIFQENLADDLSLYIEVYFDRGQCNFEIFSKSSLTTLANANISLPISVYVLDDTKLQEWEAEVVSAWND
jgi:hypothetical protein